MKGQEIKSGQASFFNVAQKKNLFYALHSRGEQDFSSNVVNNMLNVFSFTDMIYLIQSLLL